MRHLNSRQASWLLEHICVTSQLVFAIYPDPVIPHGAWETAPFFFFQNNSPGYFGREPSIVFSWGWTFLPPSFRKTWLAPPFSCPAELWGFSIMSTLVMTLCLCCGLCDVKPMKVISLFCRSESNPEGMGVGWDSVSFVLPLWKLLCRLGRILTYASSHTIPRIWFHQAVSLRLSFPCWLSSRSPLQVKPLTPVHLERNSDMLSPF